MTAISQQLRRVLQHYIKQMVSITSFHNHYGLYWVDVSMKLAGSVILAPAVTIGIVQSMTTMKHITLVLAKAASGWPLIIIEVVADLYAALLNKYSTNNQNLDFPNFKTLFFEAFEIAHIIFTTLRLENWIVPV